MWWGGWHERGKGHSVGFDVGCPEAQETVAWREVRAEEVSVGVRHVHIVITRWQGMCHPGRREMREPTNELW